MTEETRSIGERLAEFLKPTDDGLNMQQAMRLAFNKCPYCNTPLSHFRWIRGCMNRSCQKYISALNIPTGQQIDFTDPEVQKAYETMLTQQGLDP